MPHSANSARTRFPLTIDHKRGAKSFFDLFSFRLILATFTPHNIFTGRNDAPATGPSATLESNKPMQNLIKAATTATTTATTTDAATDAKAAKAAKAKAKRDAAKAAKAETATATTDATDAAPVYRTATRDAETVAAQRTNFRQYSDRDTAYLAFFGGIMRGNGNAATLAEIHNAGTDAGNGKRRNPRYTGSAKATDAGAINRLIKAGYIVSSDNGNRLTATAKAIATAAYNGKA